MPLFKEELKAYEAQTVKSSIDEPLEVELKDLPHHLEYAFLEGDNKLPVIIAKELGSNEKAALIKNLKSHKRAIAWKLSDIQGINPKFCTYKILMEEDYKPAVQHQRRVNPKIHDVIKKEVEKLFDAGLIYPISDSPWVSPVHCVPKKDSLNSAAGGNFLDKMPRECLKIIERKSKVRQSRAKAVVAKVGTSSSTLAISTDVVELKDMVKSLLSDKRNQSPAPTPSTTPAP
nr:reverse transcriptase domain-containing protein [Tanacetum cinerariifolium]